MVSLASVRSVCANDATIMTSSVIRIINRITKPIIANKISPLA